DMEILVMVGVFIHLGISAIPKLWLKVSPKIKTVLSRALFLVWMVAASALLAGLLMPATAHAASLAGAEMWLQPIRSFWETITTHKVETGIILWLAYLVWRKIFPKRLIEINAEEKGKIVAKAEELRAPYSQAVMRKFTDERYRSILYMAF